MPVLSKNTSGLKTGTPGRFDRHRSVASPRSGACRRRCRRFEFSAHAGKTPVLRKKSIQRYAIFFFADHSPRWRKAAQIVEKCGDNCYAPTSDGEFRQLRSGHWDHKRNRENRRQKMTDLGGERVLVGRRFCYFGSDAIPFPADVSFRTPARFNRVNFTDEERGRLQEFLEDLPQGIQGCLRCLLLVMCTHPFAKKALTLHLARSEGHERYFGCNLMHRKVLASSYQHIWTPQSTPFSKKSSSELLVQIGDEWVRLQTYLRPQ